MRLRFSIRDCLLVTAIVGLTLGWRVDRNQLARQFSKQLDETQGQLAAQRVEMDVQLNVSKVVGSRWRQMALTFAREMRNDGWYVSIHPPGGSFAYTPRSHFESSGESAEERNRAHPLPEF
jgi:hypothetical protein